MPALVEIWSLAPVSKPEADSAIHLGHINRSLYPADLEDPDPGKSGGFRVP